MNQDNVVDDASSSSNEDTQAAPEHRYNLRNTDNIDYMSMRRFGETQLMQVQQEWVTQMQHKAKINNNKEPNSINMKSNDLHHRIIGVTMLQMTQEDKYAQVSVTEGIKRYGGKAVAAILPKFTQLNHKNTFKPCNPKELSANEKREAQNLITMIKQKRDGKIKGRACADGRKQRRYIKRKKYHHPHCNWKAS